MDAKFTYLGKGSFDDPMVGNGDVVFTQCLSVGSSHPHDMANRHSAGGGPGHRGNIRPPA